MQDFKIAIIGCAGKIGFSNQAEGTSVFSFAKAKAAALFHLYIVRIESAKAIKMTTFLFIVIIHFFLQISATASQCRVRGNISTGVTDFAMYPTSPKSFKSRAKVAGSQET